MNVMNHFTRIALAAGLLAAPVLPAFAQNGTPLTGTTSTTPSTQPALPSSPTIAPKTTATHHATTTMPKTHHMAKATTKKPATPVSAPASQTPSTTTQRP
jgi:hypothetical protein